MKTTLFILFSAAATVGIACLDSLGKAGAEQAVLEHMDATLAQGVQPDGIAVRRLASGPDVYSPWVSTFSPDGRYEAFTWWDGDGDVAVRDLQTMEIRKVTTTAEAEKGFSTQNAFSRDGSRLAYAWWIGNQATNEGYVLKTVGRDGTNPVEIYNPYSYAERHMNFQLMDWHPDGEHILIGLFYEGFDDGSVRRPASRLLSVPLDGSDPEVVRSEDGKRIPPRQARYSPDGRYVAFGAMLDTDDNGWDVLLFDTESGQETVLLGGPSMEMVLGWSTDGSRVYVASNRSGSEAIWAVPVSSGRRSGSPILIRRDVHGLVNNGVLSSEVVNNRLYYHTYLVDGGVSVAEVDPDRGRLISEPVPETAPLALFPRWSPDGRYLAYARESMILVRGADSDLVHEYALPDGFSNIMLVEWTLDSRELLVHAQGEANPGAAYQLFLNVDSGEYRIDSHTVVEGRPTSRDAKRTYKATSAGVVGVANVEGEEGPGILVAGDDEVFQQCSPAKWGGTALSPREEWVAFWKRSVDGSMDVCLGIVPASGGPMRWIHRAPSIEHRVLRFTPDGQNLLFGVRQEMAGSGGRDDRYTVGIQMIPVDGGEPRTLLVDRNIRDVSLHPDGRRLAYQTRIETHELWMLEGIDEIGAE